MQITVWHAFPPPFDWKEIIASDHWPFLNNWPMTDSAEAGSRIINKSSSLVFKWSDIKYTEP